ncbi:MAG: hypothetical protein ACYCXX_01195, partial [Acidiferrobacter thiooxydans]
MPGLGLANDADDILRSELAALEALITRDGECYVAHHHDLILGSAFQPIVSVAHRRPVAHEALLRAGAWIKPLLVAFIDDRSRYLCHAQWYAAEGTEQLVHGFSQA